MNINKISTFWALLLALILVLSGISVFAPAQAQEEGEGDTPQAFAVVPGTPLQVIEVSNLASEERPQAFTVPSHAPLQITEISVSPEPRLGQAFTLRIEAISVFDEPQAAILVDLPKGVELVQGSLLWQGALTANRAQAHEVTLRLLQEGDWRLWIGASSQIAENDSYALRRQLSHQPDLQRALLLR